jgi:hypothetical protein
MFSESVIYIKNYNDFPSAVDHSQGFTKQQTGKRLASNGDAVVQPDLLLFLF